MSVQKNFHGIVLRGLEIELYCSTTYSIRSHTASYTESKKCLTKDIIGSIGKIGTYMVVQIKVSVFDFLKLIIILRLFKE